MTLRQRLLAAILALAASLPAGAASIYLVPSSDIVITDEEFTVQVLINASDAPGYHPGLYGGQIVVDYDPSQLGYVGFQLAGGVSFYSAPQTGVATGGIRQTVTLGFDNAPDTGVVGTFTFRALAAPEQVATIGLADYDSFFGTFAAYVPTYQPFYPDFAGTSVTTAIPLPGAAWLFLAGVGAALGRARRRSTAAR
jgi:MYXO-CTERM domain-containing protein